MEHPKIYCTSSIGIKQALMFHKIKSVKPLPAHTILVQFENGENKKYDITPLCNDIEAFKALLYVEGLFNQVKVDGGGYGISWNDDIDLSCTELYTNGTVIAKIW
jgi:hypothetical protein